MLREFTIFFVEIWSELLLCVKIKFVFHGEYEGYLVPIIKKIYFSVSNLVKLSIAVREQFTCNKNNYLVNILILTK